MAKLTSVRKKPARTRGPGRGKRDSVLPLHHRIYIVLRRRLVEGRYPADLSMPGEHQLAEEFIASRVTIRRVLDQLHKEKLIDRRHGAGTFPTSSASGRDAEPPVSYFDYIAASSHAQSMLLIELAELPVPLFLTQIDPRFGPTVLKIVRVAAIKGVPHHLLRTYVPGEFGRLFSGRSLGNKTVLEVLKRKGISPRESEIRMGAMAADTVEARHLKVAVGVPLVQVIRISRLTDGRVVEYNEILSVADIVAYRFSFDWRNGTVKLPAVE
jgi:GntR family transcriptional regulator